MLLTVLHGWLLPLMGAGCHSQYVLSHGVATCLLLSPIVAGCLSQSLRFHRVAACLPLSPMGADILLLSHRFHGVAVFHSLSLGSNGFATCLSLSLPVRWSWCISLTVTFCCWLSLTVSPSPMEMLLESQCLQLLLPISHSISQFKVDYAGLSQSAIIASLLSLSILVPWSCCMFLTIFHCCWRSLIFSPSGVER